MHRGREELTEIFERYLTEHRGIEPYGNNMLAIFEHDRDGLVVAFPDTFETKKFMTNEGEKESVKTGNRIVELKLKYSSIRRVIVELDYNDEDEITASFTLQFRYPPTGRVLMDCLDRLRKNIDSPIEFRFLIWKIGKNDFDSRPRAIINPLYYSNTNFFSELDKYPDFLKLRDIKYFPLVSFFLQK
uniref:Uncharacterized protein n=1 Tax=Panagrolaimus sp. ES5 TaxID=591445 RepID=A0AC34FX45_9BILA